MPQAVVWPGGAGAAPVTDDVLKLGLLLPVTGSWKGGRTIAGAAALAAQRVNDDPSLLGGIFVEYVWEDAGCDVGSGVGALFKLLGGSNIDGVIGPGERLAFGLASA